MESFPALLHWYTIGLVPYRGVLVYVNLVISWNRQESKRSQDADATGYFHFHIQLAICTSIAWSKGVRGVGVGGDWIIMELVPPLIWEHVKKKFKCGNILKIL